MMTLNDFIIKDHGSLVGFYPTNAIKRTSSAIQIKRIYWDLEDQYGLE